MYKEVRYWKERQMLKCKVRQTKESKEGVSVRNKAIFTGFIHFETF